jgi:hypothetical protein
MHNKTLILTFVAAVFILGGLLYIYNPTPQEYTKPGTENGVVCTQDAMLCPDGSYVGRSGPNCAFDACPIPKDAIMEDGTLPDNANNEKPSGNEPVFCTLDAKQCPDGSYVGRVGPKCEFAPCPQTKSQ